VTVEVRDLSFAYGEEPVLDGVDLTVDDGELVGLLGPNGSGKSTLLECCNRILAPDAGSVRIDGVRVADLGRDETARLVGYVPQSESSAFPATVFDTILMGRRPHAGWTPSEADRDAVADVIEALDLSAFAMRTVDELSGGQRQKVRLGRALVQEASALLLDEPTAGLDLKHQLSVLDHLAAHVQGGALSGIVALHDLNLASRYCDRVALLSDGRLAVVGDPSDLTPGTIEEVYDVEVTIAQAAGRRIVIPERPVGRREAPIGDGVAEALSADGSGVVSADGSVEGETQSSDTSPGDRRTGDDHSWWRRLLDGE
jgi:iron complex transport system ATP-binding protein